MPLPDLRVLIVGDNPFARAGLAGLLDGLADLLIVGQAAPDTGLGLALEAQTPEVVVWDMGWEPGRALEQLASVRDDAPPILVLLADAQRAADALAAGAAGVLLQETDPVVLSAALRAVAQGLLVLAPDLRGALLGAPAAGDAPAVDALTARELEVVALLAEGLPNKGIAARLGISEHTVKFHVNAVMSKLGAQSRTEAVVRATRLGLISL